MSLHLYELSGNYLKALDFLTDPENEIDQQTAVDTIESMDGELDDKIINVGRVIANLEAAADSIKAAEKRQAERRKALESKAAWLREYLIRNMDATGHTKVAADDIELRLAKLPDSVQIQDESQIPADFWREKVERVIDKTAIKNSGGCPGAIVSSAGYRVSIK